MIIFKLEFTVESGELSKNSVYTATDTALAECVEGNPYSRATECDIVIRFRGGDNGRGKHHMSLMKPLKKTPDANTCIILHRYLAHKSTYPLASTYPLPKSVYPHQNKMGKKIMKKVWVPRLAVIEK